MALILRGNRTGDTVAIVQFCNNWFVVQPNDVYSPTSLRLDSEEVARVREAERANKTGTMFSLFVLDDASGRFKRRPRMGRR